MGAKYVAITDNADPMDVVVYRRAKHRLRQPAGLHRAGVQRRRRLD